ncbi:hypothetical protein OROMI_033965 [Orobanche minor]
MFLTKLLTEDLPKLFVRPKKLVLDFQKGKAVGPIPNDSKSGENLDGNNGFAGELSVTLLYARKLSYIFYGKTDPYVILRLGDQVIRSKRKQPNHSDRTSWFADPRKEKLFIEVKDSLEFIDFTLGIAQVDLGSLTDTVPADRRVVVGEGWSLFENGSAGEILLRLTYKGYVEDEEDEKRPEKVQEASEDDFSGQRAKKYIIGPDKESFMDVLAALLLSEDFRGIMSETLNATVSLDDAGIISGNTSEPNVPTAKTQQQISASATGSTLLWLAFVTSISVLIALKIGDMSLFNP